uniref:Sialidase n=1 Tax=Opalinidae sp. TaxID=2059444 RepID=A0A649UZH4_9STRA|nr:sialidase [Opalinidae sp.]
MYIIHICVIISFIIFSLCDPLIHNVPVFVHGEGGYPCIRIPAIIRTHTGKLLAFAECRKFIGDGCTPTDGKEYPKQEGATLDGRICLKSSTDDGYTWSNLSFPAGTELKMDDPEPVYDFETNTVVLMFKCDDKLTMIRSKDEGVTWSERVDHSAAVSPYGQVYPGPASGIQKTLEPHKGRLLWIGHYGAYDKDILWYSDDHGETIKMSQPPLPGVDEAQLVELHNGTVLANMRTPRKFGNYRAGSISVDGGNTYTLPYPEPKLIEPVCQASIIRDTQTNAFFFSNPHHITQRVNMTIQRSDNNCETWSKKYTLHPGKAGAYSGLTSVSTPGAIGLLWESEYEKCTGTCCVIYFSLVKSSLE